MNITINTDASFCPMTKAGGYAFYIVCDTFKIQKAGKFIREPKTATEAEAMCIGNAMATLMAQKELPKVWHLIINTDCLGAVSSINSKHKVFKEVRTIKNKLIKRVRPQIFQFRHVKAHNGSPDARSWVNEWCDTEAKKYMRIQRKEKEKVLAN